MKSAWICFHKNANKYNPNWIEDYVNSFYWQTVKIPVYEINYGGTKERLFRDSKFFKEEFTNHADAHNFILDQVFKDGFDYAFNSNIDDIYNKQRVEIQLNACKKGYDIISCNHTIIDENNMENIEAKDIQFSAKSPSHELAKSPPHNIISHPGVVYSRRFWTQCPKLNPKSIPKDDMELWQWAIGKGGFTFHIVPQTLLWYRVHAGSVAAPRRKQNA